MNLLYRFPEAFTGADLETHLSVAFMAIALVLTLIFKPK